MHPGLKVATAYSLPSYQLGFCGPQEAKSKKILLDFSIRKKVDEKLVKEALMKFEAPYPYFKLIAKSNSIADPFDEQVVKAMWVGNELLDNVQTEDLRNLIRTEFAKPGLLSREEAEKRAKKVPDGAIPHHSFHVLVLGAVSDRITLKGAMLDLCRTGWGKVLKVTRNKLQVKSRSLVLGRNITLGKEVEKEIGWSRKIVPNVKKGDWVSFHWGQACEILTPTEVKSLEYYTRRTIDLVSFNKRL